jgi:ribonucleoside-diphosphate reductase alpha chain
MTNNDVDKDDVCDTMGDMMQAGTEGIKVKKRDGSEEYFDAEKINRVLNWATEGITGVSASDVAVKANLSLTNGISTDDIHQTLVDTAGDMISEHSPNYTKVAARLYIYMLRKKVWGGKNPPKLYDLIKENIDRGFYDTALLEKYTKQEIDKIDEFIDHARDDYFDYGGLVQLTEKYLIQNRKTKEIYETPQFQIALIGMIVFQNESPEERIKWIKKCYDKVSRFCLSLPTPILSGARSKTRSYSSCCLIEVDDTKQSLFAANTTAGMVTCDRYGVGLNLGKLRNINAPIKNGDTLHSGVISWLKMYQDTIHACQQGGARRGAGTVTFPIFHPEIMTILELKNNQGTHENRVPHLDYSIGMSNLFYDRLKQNKDITLFSHHEAPKLYNSFGTPEFDKNYLEFEDNNPNSIRISARELYAKFFTERLETARYYCINVDQANLYSPWVDTVQISNLCQEVLHPLISESYTGDPEAEIGVCILAAINPLKIKNDHEHQQTCELAVRMLDNIIDIQEYTVKACENFAKNKRSLGIGITNFSGWLASKGLNHNSPETPQVASDFMEKQQYYLMEASKNLAKERGMANHFNRSKYFNGEKSPLDLYNKNLDKLIDVSKMDWSSLMEEIKLHGMRNMTMSCQMPCESSSVLQASTNGVEPITSLVVRKTSKGKTCIQVVPGISKWKNNYLKKSDIKNNDGIIKVNAAIGKWLCMASSFNLYYDSNNYEDGNVPMSVLIKDHLYATHLGMKTFYYCNSIKKKDSLADDFKEDANGCSSGSCSL